MKQRNLIRIELAKCLWRLACGLYENGSVPLIGNRTFSCPVLPIVLSGLASYSVRTDGCLCEEIAVGL